MKVIKNLSGWLVLLAITLSFFLPYVYYYGDSNYGVWAYGSMSLIHRCIFHPCTIIFFGIITLVLLWLNHKKKRHLLPDAQNFIIFLFILGLCNFIYNPYFLESWQQIPLTLLFLVSAITLSNALLRGWSCLVWCPVFVIALVNRLTEFVDFKINRASLFQVFATSWEDVSPYLSFTNCALLIFFLLLSCFTCLFISKLLSNVTRLTLAFTGSISGLLFVIGLYPIKNDLRMATEDIWPLGNIAWIGWESAKAIDNIQKIKRLIHNFPPKETLDSKSDFDVDNKDLIIILHIGESVNASHLSLYGYHRNTTPWLSSCDDLIVFRDCTSSACFTDMASLTILTNGRRDFFTTTSPDYWPNSHNLIDYFSANGFKCGTFWSAGCLRSNATPVFSTLVEFYNRSADYSIEYSGLPQNQLEQIFNYINSCDNEGKFLLIYNSGSHVPFEGCNHEAGPFFPSRPVKLLNDRPQDNKEIENIITNAYDNTIYYTDDYIRKLIEGLRGRPLLYVYVSDHGEYLGNNDRYWFRGNAPNSDFFKYGACHVPLFIYASPEFEELHPHFREALRIIRLNQNKQVSHEHIFHTMLGLMGIKTRYYDESLDLTTENVEEYKGPHPCRQGQPIEVE